ncbi:Crp/Fnr family transcriptional regulator [Caminibacter mediatlanticus]|uniref:Transcriptional regulator, Crp/Fnr family protein n=1 Tax=Caminibacter mediatlanticus TB-2 TaxID=391592 RepID=A0AAI9AGZ3_9BACT|nr:Crp/Fnr family transcriptional regulator [Caminibacter mediatlanticus]EDM23304.1 putative transcriptional regulator, Crp/Fnr family protein [Caminibacter mediatlanticus TB-2]
MIKSLKQISLFFNIDDNTLNEIASFSKILNFKKDNIIYYEGEKNNYFYGIVNGGVLMYDTDLKGEIIPKNQFGCGDIFGLISQIQNKPYCLSAKTINDTTLIAINYDKFKTYISSPPFSDRIIKMLSNQIMQEIEFNKLQKYDTTQRVIYTLLNFPQKFVRKKKYMLAKELNMSPETLSRILSKLKNEGIICYCDKSIKVLDYSKLKNKLK